jgi:3-hydroxyisobutyrate dehydrogenase-like beta-hydroxyacid dehydrogenase
MGSRIGRRLLERNNRLVCFNRSPGPAESLQARGAVVADSPAAVAAQSDVVLLALGGPSDVAAVVGSIIEGAQRPGGRVSQVVVDLTTIDPPSSIALAKRLRTAGVEMLDAPMTGSVHAAERGTLGLMVGGPRQTLVAVAPALTSFADRIFHFGPNGSGCAAKLALNLLVAAMAQGLAESFRYLDARAVSPRLFADAISASGLSSPLYSRLAGRALGDDLRCRFAVKHLAKDLALLTAEADSFGLAARLSRELCAIVRSAADQLGELDYAALIRHEREDGHWPFGKVEAYADRDKQETGGIE